MSDEHAPEPALPAAPLASSPEPPTAGEWAIGILFVLAALGLVAWIGWTIWML